ncbi:TetR/AcrR family transcriptional regulator [Jiangella anatolica]|uniref:TetR family transcriptional regulator n=1 Tax=Jiangella anatolica TaxID=2670374 RepID=A0A2W2BBY8_9ACTN|nr:TetR/AcrR family transcriptional regulator [Jiangella anatolica]PZF85141.1 TetR family transcriptional regulator [Jiangella anatolica]
MSDRDEVRRRIIEAAATLLREQGREAVTTRAVSAAAEVQAPTLYRLFTDMSGLLEAVADDGVTRYLAQKEGVALTDDPVDDLRRGWDTHVEFGLENPAHYVLMYGQPAPGVRSRAADRTEERLHLLVSRVAVAGRLTVGVATAMTMVHAAGTGLTLTLIATPPDQRDLSVVARLRDAVIGAITTTEPSGPPVAAQRAAGLKAVLDDADGLYSPGERAILEEFLDRAADQRP